MNVTPLRKFTAIAAFLASIALLNPGCARQPEPSQEAAAQAAATPAPPATQAAAPADAPAGRPPIRDFTFLHLTDTHIDPTAKLPDSLTGLRSIPVWRMSAGLGPVRVGDGDFKTLPPSFLIHTGDITEFGYPGATGEVRERYLSLIDLPKHLVPGNHDNTWNTDEARFPAKRPGMNISFDYGGVHFVGLNTASLQEPLPSLGEETVRFLREDLARVHPDTPVIAFCHHPLDGSEFASRYDADRILDLLKERNTVAVLTGHYHSSRKQNYYGVDGAIGGATFHGKGKKDAGATLVTFSDGTFRTAYLEIESSDTAKLVLRKPVPERRPYPQVRIESPRAQEEIAGTTLSISAEIDMPGERMPASAHYFIDETTSAPLTLTGTRATASVSLATLDPGAHALRVLFIGPGGKSFTRSTDFLVNPPETAGTARAAWRVALGGSVKATPAVADGTAYIGAGNGVFRSVSLTDGSTNWTYATGGMIASTAALVGDVVVFGSGDGHIYGLEAATGARRWKIDAGKGVYGAAVADAEGIVYIGTNAGEVFAVRAANGEVKWRWGKAAMAIESAVCLGADKVFVGAWDGYVYAIDRATGTLAWKQAGPKCQETVNRYYAPGDAAPVLADGRLYVADRSYRLGAYDPGDGKYLGIVAEDVAAIEPTDNGKALLVRTLKGKLHKLSIGERNSVAWRSQVAPGRFPVAPVVRGNEVIAATNRGRLFVMDASTGATKWNYQLSPTLFVMGGPVATDRGILATSGTDGYLTLITPPAAAVSQR